MAEDSPGFENGGLPGISEPGPEQVYLDAFPGRWQGFTPHMEIWDEAVDLHGDPPPLGTEEEQ